MNSFISSQSDYCPPVWVFNYRATSTKLNCSFERTPRLLCKGNELKASKTERKCVTISQHNRQLLLLENLKSNNVDPAFMKSY